jgi:hypothetical protein
MSAIPFELRGKTESRCVMNVSEVVKVVEHFGKERQPELAEARSEIERLKADNKTLAESVCDMATERLGVEAKCERLQSLTSRDSDLLRDRTAEIEQLTSERDGAVAAKVRADRLYQDVSEDRASVAEERDRLERELAEARELLREFRIDINSSEELCLKYDRLSRQWGYGQPEQPELVEASNQRLGKEPLQSRMILDREEPTVLVPWNEHTRPRGVVLFRFPNISGTEIILYQWGEDGPKIGDVWFKWDDLCDEEQGIAEWSDDGRTWQRCGVPRG